MTIRLITVKALICKSDSVQELLIKRIKVNTVGSLASNTGAQNCADKTQNNAEFFRVSPRIVSVCLRVVVSQRRRPRND